MQSLVTIARTARRIAPAAAFVALIACEGPKAPHAAPASEVPANSLSESRLHGAPSASVAPQAEDPTAPYLQPVGPSAGASADAGKTIKTGKVTKAECAQLFDRYLELAMGTDDRLEGLPPEILSQAKAQARQQKGDPCDKQEVPRAKYNCAIAAGSTQEWEACMK